VFVLFRSLATAFPKQLPSTLHLRSAKTKSMRSTAIGIEPRTQDFIVPTPRAIAPQHGRGAKGALKEADIEERKEIPIGDPGDIEEEPVPLRRESKRKKVAPAKLLDPQHGI
jgi:hypothetical protein